MAPMAKSKASVSTVNGLVRSGCRSTGSEVKAFFSVSNASWVVGVQQKGESFRVSAISGCTNVENVGRSEKANGKAKIGVGADK